MNLSVDEGLFEIFSGSFVGFGHYRSPVWFVGPFADLLGRDESEAARRLEIWHRRGQPTVVDLQRIHTLIGEDRWFGDHASLHRVWSKLARVSLAFEGRPVVPNVRAYQATELARGAGGTTLIHLLAVDARRDNVWPYRRLETPYLRSPELYAERFTERRARHIARQVQRYRPSVVVFYDVTHRRWWEQIAGVSFGRSEVRSCFGAQRDGTIFLMIRHPESVGTRNEYFARAGSLAAALATNAEAASLPPP